MGHHGDALEHPGVLGNGREHGAVVKVVARIGAHQKGMAHTVTGHDLGEIVGTPDLLALGVIGVV